MINDFEHKKYVNYVRIIFYLAMDDELCGINNRGYLSNQKMESEYEDD